MGWYVGKGPTGQHKGFIINGDTPTDFEMEQIQRILGNAEAPEPAPPEVDKPGVLTSLGHGIAQGWNQAQAGVDTGVGMWLEHQGEKKHAREYYEAAQAQREEAATYPLREGAFYDEDSISGGVANLAGTFGNSLVPMVAGIGAGFATGNPLVAAGVAGALSAPQILDADAQRQIEKHGYIKDPGKLVAGTLVSAAVEGLSETILGHMGGAFTKVLPATVAKEAVSTGIKKGFTQLAKKLGVGGASAALSEGGEEVVQQVAERWQAGLPLGDDKAIKEYIENGVTGAVLGAAIGGPLKVYGEHDQLKRDQAYQDAVADAEAEAQAKGATAGQSVPAYQKAREAPYQDNIPVEPPAPRITDAGHMLPDFSAETREQKMLGKDTTPLPPGLGDIDQTQPNPTPAPQAAPLAASAARSDTIPKGVINSVHGPFGWLSRQRMLGSETTPQALYRAYKEPIDRATSGGDTEGVAYAQRILDNPNAPSAPSAAAPTATPTPPLARPVSRETPHGPHFTEAEYRDAVLQMRGPSFSANKIETNLKVPAHKAEALFAEMLRRNDAYPSGNRNQYAQITVPHGMPTRTGSNETGKPVGNTSNKRVRARDYMVKPVRSANAQPFSLKVRGKTRKVRFSSREQADAFIQNNIPENIRKNVEVMDDGTGQQYGIYEQSYDHLSNGEQHLVGERVVNTFNSEEDAKEAIKDYDPAYSPESNKWRTRMTDEERNKNIAADVSRELGPIAVKMQARANQVIGGDRATVGMATTIPSEPGTTVEGQTVTGKDVKGVIQSVIMLAHDIYSKNLSEEQRAKMIEEVLNHELIHVIRSLDILGAHEWSILHRAALNQKVPGKTYTWMQWAVARNPGTNVDHKIEEGIAEMFRYYLKDPTAFRSPERGILKKIAEFVRRLMGLAKRHDAADLMDFISHGGVASRETGSGQGGWTRPLSADDTFHSLTRTDNFYMKTMRYLESVRTPDKENWKGYPVDQWRAMLKGAGIRQDERDWLSLDQWLDQQKKDKPAITKNEIMNYVKSHMLDMKILVRTRDDDLRKIMTKEGQRYGRPEWEGYRLSGGKGYTEAAFIMPSFRTAMRPDEPGFPGDISGHVHVHDLDNNAQRNVLAFTRFDTRFTREGKRVLNVLEVQSDLHQQAQNAGYYSEEQRKAMGELLEQRRALSDSLTPYKDTAAQFYKKFLAVSDELKHAKYMYNHDLAEQLRRQRDVAESSWLEAEAEHETKQREVRQALGPVNEQIKETAKRLSIPNAPFKTTWQDYVMKRLIRHALEHGFDAISWHGEIESIQENEQYPDVITRTNDQGQESHFAVSQFNGEEKNVSAIVNRYLRDIPRSMKNFVRPFGADVSQQNATPEDQVFDIPDHPAPTVQGMKDGDGKIIPEFHYPWDYSNYFTPDGAQNGKSGIKKLYNRIHHRFQKEFNQAAGYDKTRDEALDLVMGVERAMQRAINLRPGTPDLEHVAFQDILSPDEVRTAVLWASGANTYEDAKGQVATVGSNNNPVSGDRNPTNFPFKFNMIEFTSPMREAFERNDISLFSSTRPSQPQYSAAAPLGSRVPTIAPIDTLDRVHAAMTYNVVAPKIQWALGKVGLGSHQNLMKVEDSFIQLQDRMQPLAKLIDRVKKNKGFIATENDAYLQSTLFPSQTDFQLSEADRLYYKPLKDAINATRVTRADADEAGKLNVGAGWVVQNYPHNPHLALAELYLYAQHAIERNIIMRQRNENTSRHGLPEWEYGSGIRDDDATEILDWFRSKAFGSQFNDENNPNSVRSRQRALIKYTNDTRVEMGLNPDFRIMKHSDGSPVDIYKDYAPLRGFLGEDISSDSESEAFLKTGKGFNIRGKEDFAAAGRNSYAADLVATSIMQNQESIVRGNKNKVGQRFYNMVLENPKELADVAAIEPSPRMKWQYIPSTGRVRLVPDQRLHSDPSVLKVKVGGEQKYIKIRDERLARAMNSPTNLGQTGFNTMLKWVANLNRMMIVMRTSWNPEFILPNWEKDVSSALINLGEHEKSGLRKAVLKAVLPAAAGIRKALRSGDMNTEWGRVYQEFQTFGGHSGFYGIHELYDTIHKVNKEFAKDMSGSPDKFWKTAVPALGRLVSDYNTAVENSTRLSVYKTLRDHYLAQTNDPNSPTNQKRAKEMAAFAAKRMTVNFNAGGETRPILNSFYMFFNASMQGTMALVEPMIRSKKVRRMWGTVLAAGILQDLLMSALSPEGDDGKLEYDTIPDYVLEHNLVLLDPLGISERGYYKVPLPYLMNGIFNLGRAASRYIRGEYTMGKMLSSGGMTMLDSVNPLGGANTFLNFVAPSLLDPVVDLYVNEDFSGKPIEPAENPFGLNEVASQRYWNNTNPLSITIADWISSLTGRQGDYIGGAVEISPNRVEYLLEQVFGGVGTAFMKTAGTGSHILGLDEAGTEFDPAQMPVLRKFYGKVTDKNNLQEFIEGRDSVLRVRQELKDAQKDGDSERYLRVMHDFPDQYKISARINAIENARRKLASKIKKIKDSSRISDANKDEYIRALKDRQDMLVGKGNELLNEYGIQ